MSGANATAASSAQDQHGADQRGHEPSMEEILASIRRIISDDQMLPLSPRASLPPLPPTSGSALSLQARQDGQVAGLARPGSQHAEHLDDGATDEHADVLDLAEVAQHEDEERPLPGAPQVVEARLPDPAPRQQAEAVDHFAADGTYDAMAATEHSEPAQPAAASHRAASPPHAPDPIPPAAPEPEPPHQPLVSDQTLSSVSSHFHQLTATMLMQNFPPVDQIARELLRPMIKSWLDDNLPVMVERLVRAEIERVARVGR